MNPFVQNSAYNTWARYRVSLRIALVLLISFAVMNIAILLLSRQPITLTNPFSSFEDVMPGNLQSEAIEAHGFSCVEPTHNYYEQVREEHCLLYPPTGTFSSVEIVSRGALINQTSFIIREETLTIGDLTTFLKTRSKHAYPGAVYFFLPSALVSARTSMNAKRFSLFISVWSVVFTGMKSIGDYGAG